jgi:von Willebrand factor type A domain
MSSSRSLRCLLCILALQAGSVAYAPQGRADQREIQQPRAAIDAVLLIDASGSMLQTDPQLLRYDGAKLFLQFLGKDDRLAIVSFADKARVVSDLRDFSKESSDSFVKEIQGIKAEGEYTDLLEGIRTAEKVLEASPRNDAERVIVLLSDGKMEPSPSVALPAARTLELVNQELPSLKSKEIKIHSLAFSKEADKMLLSEISASTDGLSWYTSNSEEVHKSFANLFLAVKRPQIVPMRSRSFTLDDDVDEATFYITRDEGAKLTLLSPKNDEMTVEKHPDWVTWFAGKNFDVITMKEPDVGEWQVEGGMATEGFATVLTNLKLVTDWPVVVRVDDNNIVQARLYDGERPVALPEMSGVIKYAFQVMPTDRVAPAVAQDFLNDEGRDGDRIAKDGIFSKYCPISEVGEYKLSIVAQGPTFERTQQVPFRVRPRLITLDIMSPHDAELGDEHDAHGEKEEGTHGGGESHGSDSSHDAGSGLKDSSRVVQGDQDFVIRAEISKEALLFRDLQVKLEAISHERRRTVTPLKRHSSDSLNFEALADVLPQDGTYTIRAVLTGVSKKGQEIEAQSKPVRFEFKATAKRPEATPTAVHKEAHADEAKKEEGFPILPIALASVASLIAMVVGLLMTKQSKGKVQASQRYNPPKQMLDAIASLEEKLTPSDIKIGDVKLEGEAEASSDPQPAKADAASPEQESAEPQAAQEPTDNDNNPSSPTTGEA